MVAGARPHPRNLQMLSSVRLRPPSGYIQRAFFASMTHYNRIGETGMHLTAGLALVSICMVYTYTYESFFAGNSRSLVRASKEGVTVTGFDPDNNGKLIHFIGRLSISSDGRPAEDPDIELDSFFAERKRPVKLNRHVQMCQWRRTCYGDLLASIDAPLADSHTFDKVWSEKLLPAPSGGSGLHNPPTIPLKDHESTATGLKLGPFVLSDLAIKSLPSRGMSPVFVPRSSVPKFRNFYVSAATFNCLRLSECPDHRGDMVGDIKLKYNILFADDGDVTIVCRQSDVGELEAYSFTDSGSPSALCPRPILFARQGRYDMAEVLELQNDRDSMEMLKFRAVTLLGNFCGCALLYRPVLSVMSRNPVTRTLWRLGPAVPSVPVAIFLTVLPIMLKYLNDVFL